MNLPTLSSNYVWDTSQLAVNGTIVVTQPKPKIGFVYNNGANTMQLSWSNGFSDYILQAQTNALGVGIQSNNWFTVSTTTNSITVDVDRTNNVFFRLTKP
jgi:hypothetical protein